MKLNVRFVVLCFIKDIVMYYGWNNKVKDM